MNKKLPGVYVNKIDKELKNNKCVFYSQNEDLESFDDADRERSIKSISNSNIEQKIQDIFRSSNYIYKADVVITTESGTTEKRIVGKHNGNLITMDNQLIPISTIFDISLK